MIRYSDAVIKWNDDLSHVGELAGADQTVGVGSAGSGVSGALIKLFIRVDATQMIRQTRFKAWGDCAIIAVSAWIADWLENKPLKAAKQITADILLSALDLPASKRHCALLGVRAITAALTDYQAKQEQDQHGH